MRPEDVVRNAPVVETARGGGRHLVDIPGVGHAGGQETNVGVEVQIRVYHVDSTDGAKGFFENTVRAGSLRRQLRRKNQRKSEAEAVEILHEIKVGHNEATRRGGATRGNETERMLGWVGHKFGCSHPERSGKRLSMSPMGAYYHKNIRSAGARFGRIFS